jgi:DUF971 family protein
LTEYEPYLSPIKPKGITANRYTNILEVVWRDEHESIYPFSLLRRACPCAECQGGHQNIRLSPTPDLFSVSLEDSPSTRLINIEAVGTYAISLEWEDGHHYGIYPWTYLRGICPCPLCRHDPEIKL